MSKSRKKVEIALIMTFKIPSKMIKLGFFNFGVLNILMIFFWFSHARIDPGLQPRHYQTKSSQTKPFYDHSFHWSHSWTNSLTLNMLLTTCALSALWQWCGYLLLVWLFVIGMAICEKDVAILFSIFRAPCWSQKSEREHFVLFSCNLDVMFA